jgi:hypothetical protein
VNPHIEVLVCCIYWKFLSVVDLGQRSVIIHIRYSLNCRKMILWTLIIHHEYIFVLSKLHWALTHHHILFPQLIWFGPWGHSRTGLLLVWIVVRMHLLKGFLGLGKFGLRSTRSGFIMASLRSSALFSHHFTSLVVCGDVCYDALLFAENGITIPCQVIIVAWRIHCVVKSLIKSISLFEGRSHFILVKLDTWKFKITLVDCFLGVVQNLIIMLVCI